MNKRTKIVKYSERLKVDARTCPLCQLSFPSRKAKTVHMRYHRPRKPVAKYS